MGSANKNRIEAKINEQYPGWTGAKTIADALDRDGCTMPEPARDRGWERAKLWWSVPAHTVDELAALINSERVQAHAEGRAEGWTAGAEAMRKECHVRALSQGAIHTARDIAALPIPPMPEAKP
jgi:hypothetical protein